MEKFRVIEAIESTDFSLFLKFWYAFRRDLCYYNFLLTLRCDHSSLSFLMSWIHWSGYCTEVKIGRIPVYIHHDCISQKNISPPRLTGIVFRFQQLKELLLRI